MESDESAPPRPKLGPLLLAVFLDMVAFAIILPALPFFAMNLGATGLWLGVLLSAYSGAKLVGAAVAGRLSDHFGRRPMLVVCLAGSGLSFVLTGWSGSLLALAGARAVAGLFGGTVATAQAYIADVTRPAERARYMGLLGAAIGLGFIIGPGLGVAISRLGFVTATLVAGGLAFANAGLAAWRIQEPARPARALATATGRGLWATLERRVTRRVLAATFVTIFAFVSMETTLAFVSRDLYGLDERGFGMILVFVGFVMIVVQGGLIGLLSRRFGERNLAITGALMLGATMLLLPLTVSIATAAVVLGALAVGQGLASPTLATLLSRHSVADEQGGMLGIGQSVSAAGRALAPVVAGWLYDQSAAWPFLLAGVLALLGALAIAGLPSRAAEARPSS